MRQQICVIFSILLIFTILINPIFAIMQLDKMDIKNPRLENSSGVKISEHVNINQQVQVSANIKNNQDNTQKFSYIVQIKNHSGVIVSLEWMIGSLNAGQTLNPALSWTPKVPDRYTVEIFVWDVDMLKNGVMIIKPDALAEHVSIQITS